MFLPVDATLALNNLTRQFREASEALAPLFAGAPTTALAAGDDARSLGVDGDVLVRVVAGSVQMFAEGKTVLYWDEGDVFHHADLLALTAAGEPATLQIEDFARVEILPLAAAQQNTAHASALLQHATLSRQLLLLSLVRQTPPEERPAPGFRRFADGEVIVEQGAAADYVYTILEGAADVFVDNVRVGEVGAEEIFGAMAVLTGSPRTATVRARGTVSLMMVAKEDFSRLVGSHPHLALNLLKDMAGTIVSLNERVVALEVR